MEFTRFNSPIGTIEISCTCDGISQVILGAPANGSPAASSTSPILMEAARQMMEYLTRGRTTFDIPLDWSAIQGFQREVLEFACKIPFGQVLTYRRLAEMMGKPTASRAVGGALGRNPMPIFIPCHRIVGADGDLTGYSAANGIITKAWLLTLEEHTVVGKKLV